MRFDDVLRHVGEQGRFQVVQILLLSMVIFTSGVHIMMTVFTLDLPPHRCSAPGLHNDSYTGPSVQGRHYLHPSVAAKVAESAGSSPRNDSDSSLVLKYELSKCHIEYSVFREEGHTSPGSISDLGGNDLDSIPGLDDRLIYTLLHGGSNDSIKTECTSWVYDQSVFTSTIATQMNFVCNAEILKSHALSLLMIGSMVGCLAGGTAADFLGRKKLLMMALLFHLLSSVLTTWASNIFTLGIVFFVNGIALSSAYCCAFTLVLEQIGPRWRHVTGIGCSSYWSLGMLWAGLLAYFLRGWRHLQLVTSLPITLFVFFLCLVPESARWLAGKGRYAEAEDVLERMARANGKKLTIKVDLVGDLKDKEDEQDRQPKAQSIFSLLRCPPLLLRVAVVLFNWFACSTTYYGLSLNVGQLSGDIYLNFCLSALFEFAAYVTIILLLSSVGRKTLYCSTLLLSGLACLLTPVPDLIGGEWAAWGVRGLAMTGKFGIAGAFAIIWLFTPEMFPTGFRAGITGTSSCSARLGGVVASYLATMTGPGKVGHLLPQIVFGCLAFVAGALALTLPETSHARLPDSLQDAMEINKSEQKPEANKDDETESGLL